MADITLHTKSDRGVTCISNAFIDEYMADANGEYVKIYLYLLRLMSSEDIAFDLDLVADKLDHTAKDINRALEYWDNLNLIQLEYDSRGQMVGICFMDPTAKSTACVSVPSKETVEIQQANVETNYESAPKPMYSADQLTSFTQNEDTKELLFIIETFIGRTLKVTDINTILTWSDTLCFSNDLIEYLVEYCVERNHFEMKYMDRVAYSWAEKNISTVKAARIEASNFSEKYYAVMNSFGITGRQLIPSEKEFVDRWVDEYGFDHEIINEACKRTITNIAKPNFEYANRILSNWHDHSICDVRDIDRLEASTKPASPKKAAPRKSPSKRASFSTERQFDYDAIEKKLLNS